MHTLIKRVFLMVAIGTFSCAVSIAAGLSADEQAMVEWIDEHAEESIDLLEELVNIGSGTMNHDGVRKVGDVLRTELDELGMDTEWVELPAELPSRANA